MDRHLLPVLGRRRIATISVDDGADTFASHVIVDLGLEVAQVSRILGHASVTTTLNIYTHTHLFDDARHATEIRTRMASSPFTRLLEPDREPTTSSRSPAGEAAHPRAAPADR